MSTLAEEDLVFLATEEVVGMVLSGWTATAGGAGAVSSSSSSVISPGDVYLVCLLPGGLLCYMWILYL